MEWATSVPIYFLGRGLPPQKDSASVVCGRRTDLRKLNTQAWIDVCDMARALGRQAQSSRFGVQGATLSMLVSRPTSPYITTN